MINIRYLVIDMTFKEQRVVHSNEEMINQGTDQLHEEIDTLRLDPKVRAEMHRFVDQARRSLLESVEPYQGEHVYDEDEIPFLVSMSAADAAMSEAEEGKAGEALRQAAEELDRLHHRIDERMRENDGASLETVPRKTRRT